MKTIKWFALATLVIAFFSCSKSYAPEMDDDTLFDGQTRGATSQNDSTDGDGMCGTIVQRDIVTEDIVLTEDSKDEVENDTIPIDSIPKNSISR